MHFTLLYSTWITITCNCSTYNTEYSTRIGSLQLIIYTNIDAPAGSTELREVLSHPLTRMTEVRAQPRGQSALAGGSTL